MKKYAHNVFGINVAQKESHGLRMKQNLERHAFLRRRAEELEGELTRVGLEMKMNKLEGAVIHNEQVLILRLPAEITAYIFEVSRGQTRFDNSAQGGPWKSIKKRPEIIISHVCRSWRSISLAHPTLWSHFLHIHDEDSGIPVPLNWMDAYLRRSKKKPLDIILDLTCVPEEHDDNHYADRILDILIPHAFRWRRLSMYLPEEKLDPYGAPAGLRMLSAPVLEVFEIVFIDSRHYHSGEDYWIFLGGAPNLVSVRMELFRCRALIPSSTITTLDLYGAFDSTESDEPWDTFLLVMATPTLVNLTIEGKGLLEPWPIESAPRNIQRIVAPNLRNLRLHATYEVVDFIWNFVVAPKLELFAISNSDHNMSNSIPILKDLSPSTFASLKTLILLNSNAKINFLLALSRVTNDVIHLILDAENSMKTYIDHITSLRPHSALWPNLEMLTCVAEDLEDEDLDKLSLTAFAKVASWQAAVSGKPCVLRVDGRIANHWINQSESKKELWKYLFETGVVEVAREDGPYCSLIPWPHHASGHFRVGRSDLEEMDI